jgi:hypothetical protein
MNQFLLVVRVTLGSRIRAKMKEINWFEKNFLSDAKFSACRRHFGSCVHVGERINLIGN